ncbi:MAG: hypothetical protein M3Y65_04240 [Pseudomonadota bacterium]|nr:hypothetical protein [Pseudomonadota bacterium]
MHAQDHAPFDAGTLETGALPLARARAVVPEGLEDAVIRFYASDSDAPLAWRPYRLYIGGRLVLGRTDGDGCSALLSSAERRQMTNWEMT